jgi:ADP-glucose pyrophosphorylase
MADMIPAQQPGIDVPASLRRRVLGIVLAGGKGTRLYPLTRERAKPAVPFGGKYRIIDFVLSNFVNSGIYSIYVLTSSAASHCCSI